MRYDYEELRERAIETREQEDLERLADWLEQYGADCWNGECWDIECWTLWPIYVDTGEELVLAGYELR